jgi:nucleoside-diphosphate-sugar epimerase
MNILITGGAGHIGSFLFRELLKLKKVKKIYIIDSFVSNNFYSVFHIKSKKLCKINEDILNINLKNILNVQMVIHLAATTNAEKSFDNKKLIYKNLLLTKKIVEYCNLNKSTLIFPSTTSVYGSSATIVDESDNKYLNPQSPYAQVKILEENYIKNNCRNFKYLIFRMGTIYGISPGIRFHTAINKFCLQLAFSKNITIWRKNYNFVRPYLCLEDFSQIISKIINKKFIVYNEIYNLVSNNIKLKEIIKELRGLKKNLSLKFVNTKLINQHSYFVSNKKIEKCGFKFAGNLKKHIDKTVQLFF